MNTKNTILLFFTMLSASLLAQHQTVEVFHYVFPEFKRGTVLMKDGTSHQALLNYNAASEEMIFDQNGQKLAFAPATLNGLDTVFIEDTKFVLLEGQKFAEVIHQNGYKLFVQHKCRISPPGKPAAYGGTSQTSSVTSYSSWMGSGRVYELKLPDDFKVNPYKQYWLEREEGKRENFLSLRQIRRSYGKQRALFTKYTKENEVDFEDPESVATLIHYMELNGASH